MQPDDQNEATAEQLESIREYIRQGWVKLERNHGEVLEATLDAKVGSPSSQRPVVYVSPGEDITLVAGKLEEAAPGNFEKIELRRLPPSYEEIKEHGLLYLPNHYVVPGGSFNEMYGWDSYFISLGLLRDGLTPFAVEMADNHLYQVENYGKVLNANRTYYLTRSQPPFLAALALVIFRQTGDREWLGRARPLVEKYYAYWARGSHSIESEGLSRYYDSSDQPAPEVFGHEQDAEGRSHYDRVKEFYRDRGGEITSYDLPLYYDRARDRLTPRFYRADRSMRESGHDPSDRFGAFNIGVLDLLPVDLNCLLYRMELDVAEMNEILARGAEAGRWRERARLRAARIDELMWDERHGLYFDYNFAKSQRRVYPYVTTFFPLYAGIASRERAARVVDNLGLFERGGGLQTSTCKSGNQWDAPIGWAPMQLIAVEGLRRYGYDREADRISINFLSMILKEFIEHEVILEKYNVVTRESRVHEHIKYGYSDNEVGFGWTNATFIELFAGLPAEKRDDVRKIRGVGRESDATR
ncbi:MAG TPA: trehalase family glycosidase [Blastocatellia bacterium]|nr:trehalase family glycosidase [Blastocatellia bacterium]